MNAQELNHRLCDEIRTVLRELFPNGKETRGKFYVGNINGDEGKSLCIEMDGVKRGYWIDHADSKMGSKSLVGLWADVRCGGSFREACKQVRERYNIHEPSRHIQSFAAEYKKPSVAKSKKLEKKSAVMTYLQNERCLSEQTISAFRIGQSKDDSAIVFPTFEGDSLVHLKYLAVERPNGKKKTWVEGGGKPCLFGKQTIPDTADYVVICEGEIDAASWFQNGIYAVSVPMGCNNHRWIELDWEWLNDFDRIYINFDMDEPGQKAAKEVIERLGKDRCYVVELPEKDINALIVSGDESPERYIYEAKMVVPEEIGRFFDDERDIMDELYPTEDSVGTPIPWDLPFKIRRGETTIVTGYNGSGKSQGLLHLSVHLTEEKWRGFIVSMEVKPATSKALMLQIASGMEQPDRKEIDRLKESPLADTVFFKKLGHVRWKEIIESYKFCIRKYGVDFMVLDSFMLCGVSQKEYDQHNEFMSSLQILARETNTHIFIVCHSRKGSEANSESKIPGKHDVKGSGDLTDLCANLLVWWRNHEKEKAMNAAKMSGDIHRQVNAASIHDGVIRLCKQKNGKGKDRGKNGETQIWFNQANGQMFSQAHQTKKYFMHDSQ